MLTFSDNLTMLYNSYEHNNVNSTAMNLIYVKKDKPRFNYKGTAQTFKKSGFLEFSLLLCCVVRPNNPSQYQVN